MPQAGWGPRGAAAAAAGAGAEAMRPATRARLTRLSKVVEVREQEGPWATRSVRRTGVGAHDYRPPTAPEGPMMPGERRSAKTRDASGGPHSSVVVADGHHRGRVGHRGAARRAERDVVVLLRLADLVVADRQGDRRGPDTRREPDGAAARA